MPLAQRDVHWFARASQSGTLPNLSAADTHGQDAAT